MSAAPLRVMLVDDHQVVRDGIKQLVTDEKLARLSPQEERILARHSTLPGGT
jgi:hypothetical protein